jgi:hypothetical protein
MMWTLQHARPDGTFVVLRDGLPYHVIPGDPIFAEVEAAAQGVELPPEPQPEPPPQNAETLAAAVDALVESVAQAMQYRSAVHCASYANSTVAQWAAEAAAFMAWRDAVWLAVYALDPADPPATVAEVLAALPEFVRPQA